MGGQCLAPTKLSKSEGYSRPFGVEPPPDLGKYDVSPCCPATVIRQPRHADVGDEAVPEREGLPGLFGLLPHWVTDTSIDRRTYHARTGTVAAKRSFPDVQKSIQRCIIPADATYEPDWGSDYLLARGPL